MKDTFPIPGAAAPGPPLFFPRGCRPWTPPLSADDMSSTRTYCRTRRCQRVPGGSGFNWRPLATTGDQWRPVAPSLYNTKQVNRYAPGGASGHQWSPVVASWNQLVPEGARRCQGVLASMGAHGRSLATSGDQWRWSSVHAFRVLRFRALRLPKMLLKWSLCPREQGRQGPP